MIPVCVLIQVSCPFANFLSSPMGPPLAESREHPIYEFVRAAFVSKLCVPVCVARKPGTCTGDFIFLLSILGMGKGSVLSCSNFFDIVDLNRDVEASMEFVCSSVCFMWNGEPFSMVFFELTIFSFVHSWDGERFSLVLFELF